ncbi:MAG: AbrB/MazE/SpoVT family DNA-binding domain-containing protein [Candidatus Omnitrophica bacterium]|jgi:AbrB family looped-hinge helix DNA binding protein|nr:AbrB/MazE/SpoVT family DNA-binding domain-containing protein [Candidatus Omnitrophota bacterium]
MTVIGMSKITSKGQVTLPAAVRRMLKLDQGQSIAFCLNKSGIIISRCKINVEPTAFSKDEWAKIDKLASAKGELFASAEGAKRHLKAL